LHAIVVFTRPSGALPAAGAAFLHGAIPLPCIGGADWRGETGGQRLGREMPLF